jgi:hypothetical protein
MNLSHHEALAILRKLKGSSVYLRLRLTVRGHPELLGQLNLTCSERLSKG